MNLPPGRLHPPMVVGAWVALSKSCGIHLPSAWVPYRCPPSDWLGFGPSEGTIHFWIETLNSPANRPGLHKLAPRSQTKEGFCCCGVLSCVCVCFSVGLFSWLADIFLLLGSLLDSMNMSAMFTWAKCLHFGSSEIDLSDHCVKEPAHHSQIWAWRLNHQRNLRRRFQISLKRMWRSCTVQSKSSWWQSKFLGLSRLRWPGTATRLWKILPVDGQRQTWPGHRVRQIWSSEMVKTGLISRDQTSLRWGSTRRCCRPRTCSNQASHLELQPQAHWGSRDPTWMPCVTGLPWRRTGSPRRGPPNHALSTKGVTPSWRNSSSIVQKERLGTLHPSISFQLFRKKESAPRRATGGSRLMALKRRKKKRKGRILRPGGSWSGCTRFSGTTFLCVCWPSHSFNSSICARVTSMIGMTGSMDRRLLAESHLPLRLPFSGQSGMHGARFVSWWPMGSPSRIPWSRWRRISFSGPVRSMNVSCSNNSVPPESPRGKEKEKGRARPSQSKGSIRTTSSPHPLARRAGENLRRASLREDAPVVGQLTGRSNPQRESPTAGTSISSTLAKAIATDHMPAQSRSTGGPAMGITPQTSAPIEENLEPSRDLVLTAHRDRRAGRVVLRMKSQTRPRQTGSQELHQPLFLQRSISFPNQW